MATRAGLAAGLVPEQVGGSPGLLLGRQGAGRCSVPFPLCSSPQSRVRAPPHLDAASAWPTAEAPGTHEPPLETPVAQPAPSWGARSLP